MKTANSLVIQDMVVLEAELLSFRPLVNPAKFH